MKRPGSSDSLGASMSICPTTEEHSRGNNHNNHVYARDFQSMLLEGLDEEGCVEESGHISEKKRRLSVGQVKALEKNFEMENKLEPERKVKLAQELGLQQRQIAVWFQNRRARWKTKQLERDYGVLKANYESLKHNFDSLRLDNETLLKEMKELKSKLYGEKHDNNVTAEEEMSEKVKAKSPINSEERGEEEEDDDNAIELNYGTSFSNNNNGVGGSEGTPTFYPDLKDGSSDSDSSAILNEENNSSPNGAAIQSHHHQHHQFLPPATTAVNCFQFSESSDAQKSSYQAQFVKIEEHNFFSGDESCNFFSDEQAPTMHWYCHDQWN